MINIFTKPKTVPMMTTLQAKREEWLKAIEILDANNKSVFSDLIRRELKKTLKDEDVVLITLSDSAAITFLHFFGLSA